MKQLLFNASKVVLGTGFLYSEEEWSVYIVYNHNFPLFESCIIRMFISRRGQMSGYNMKVLTQVVKP